MQSMKSKVLHKTSPRSSTPCCAPRVIYFLCVLSRCDRFPNQSPSTIPWINKCNGSTPKTKEEKGSAPYVEKSPCTKFGKKHGGKYLVGMGNCSMEGSI